jgi:2-phosphosulfolactate phosphatase
MRTLEVLLTPAEFGTLPQRDLGRACCVVFDVLRATTTMLTALANGAAAVLPVTTIDEAMAWKRKQPDVLLAGERDGVRIRAELTGGGDFDLGNSPREFTSEMVGGRMIVMTTTNGTRALQACRGAREVLIGSFVGLAALAAHLQRVSPEELLLVCAGTGEEAAFEDTLAAGALAELLAPAGTEARLADAAWMARQLYRQHAGDLLAAMQFSRNGRRLLSNPDLRADVPLCLERDRLPLVAVMDTEGRVRKQ